MKVPELNVAEGLRRFRKSRGLTKSAAADAMGIRPSSYQDYEKEGGNTGNNPTVKVLYRLVKAYGVSIDYLVGLTDDPTPRWSIDGAEKETESQGDNAAAEKAEMTASEVTAHILKMEKALAAMQARLDAAKI